LFARIESRKRVARRLLVAVLAVLLMTIGSALPTVAADGSSGFPIRLQTRLPLIMARQWVLQGTKTTSGGCSFSVPTEQTPLPESRWVVRSIAIDPDACTKLMEEGIPTYDPPAIDGATFIDASQIQDDSDALAIGGSTRSAWQWVGYKDIPGLTTTYDVTEITWGYDGSNVYSGSVKQYNAWWIYTGWEKVYAYKSGSLEPSGDYYLGNTWAKFKNSVFCPGSTVYTYYYYNKMWGYPDGTATRSWSSDTINDCLRLFEEVYSAYGQYTP
jgi:hypothetical protein